MRLDDAAYSAEARAYHSIEALMSEVLPDAPTTSFGFAKS